MADHFQGFTDQIQVPVIFKEVGFGFSKQSIQQLKDWELRSSILVVRRYQLFKSRILGGKNISMMIY